MVLLRKHKIVLWIFIQNFSKLEKLNTHIRDGSISKYWYDRTCRYHLKSQIHVKLMWFEWGFRVIVKLQLNANANAIQWDFSWIYTNNNNPLLNVATSSCFRAIWNCIFQKCYNFSYATRWGFNSANSNQMNCFRNSVATSLPRVFTDNFSSLISLSMSCSSEIQMRS